MHDPLKLSAVGSVMSLISCSLAERDAHSDLYAQTIHFLQHVAAGVDPLLWLAEYVRLELALLEQAGFGLDLTTCAATGHTHDLTYVSPKSGRAVSRIAGLPYHDKMLALPEFVKEASQSPDSVEEIHAGVALTGIFWNHACYRRCTVICHHFGRILPICCVV